MTVENLWMNAVMIAACLIVGGGIVIPLFRAINKKLKFEFLAPIETMPAVRVFWIGVALVIPLFVVSYVKTGSVTGLTPAPPPPVQRTLSDPRSGKLKAQLLSDLPRDKSILVLAMLGHEEGCNFADEIYWFLQQNGFKMKEAAAACDAIIGQLVEGLKFTVEGDELKLVVGFQPR